MGSWFGGFLFVVGAGGLAAVAAWFVHDRIDDATRLVVCDRSSPITSVVGALFAVTAALTVVVGWSDLGTTGDTVAREAGATVDLYWYAHSLDDPAGGKVEGLVRDYTATVVENEWRLMRKDRALSEQASATLVKLRAELQNVEPGTTGQSDRYVDALASARDVADARQERLEQAQAKMPRVLWAVLVISGLLVVVVPLVFGAADRIVHAALAFAAAAVVVTVLVLLSEINHPFDGPKATDVVPFSQAQATYDLIDVAP